MSDFRLRQVHLDFHTSPAIDGIGERFDKKQWQETLKAGHVNSITVFAKCHHGYSYHPTKINEMHPGLKFDLLGAELEACAETGVRAPVYISAGLDQKDAEKHHDWIARGKDDFDEEPDFSFPHYQLLCFNTPYLDKLLAEIDEVMTLYNPCEIFLDIVGERTCWCAKCRADMEKEGIDWHDEENVRQFGKRIYRRYLDEVRKVIRKHNDTTTIFQNSGHLIKGRPDLVDTIEDLELESLPTGGWGYDHFPMSASYARTQRENFLGMTGKFHKTWGEFGGFKHPNALRYETALSLACGGGCSIGDQMHPEGLLNKSTFNLIGKAYAEVEEKEPWCKGAKYMPDIAVLSTEAIRGERFGAHGAADVGANRILLETKRLYNFIDRDGDFGKYKLLILPDYWLIDDVLKEKIDAFLAGGGKLLLSGVSGLKDGKFAFDTGAAYKGVSEYNPTYYVPSFETVNGCTEYLMRAQCHTVENRDAQILATGQNPYFNRTAEHFCSHQHAPNDRSSSFPAVFVKGSVAYIAWNIFTAYGESGDFHLKELANRTIEALMGDSFTVGCTLPDRGIITLLKQDRRLVVHLLFCHTTLRGRDTEVIEDVVPLYNTDVWVRAEKPSRVLLVPENKPVDFTYENGKIRFRIGEFSLHRMISIEY